VRVEFFQTPAANVLVTANGRRRHGDANMASQILDVAERLVQQRGFNGFSYADIAAELHVTKAALHYHFAGKAELGEALIARYGANFAAALDALDAIDLDAPAKLEGYARLYLDVLRNQRMCMCGMLAAEYQTLPERMQTAVIDFFNANESWLERVVAQGQRQSTLRASESARDIARAIVGGFEGAMLVARPYGDITRFEAAIRPLLAGLVNGPMIQRVSADGAATVKKRAAVGRRGRDR
jgi:TetR/AcrR family transcriptional regulator, transcriptional repressor for nem operon